VALKIAISLPNFIKNWILAQILHFGQKFSNNRKIFLKLPNSVNLGLRGHCPIPPTISLCHDTNDYWKLVQQAEWAVDVLYIQTILRDVLQGN